MKAEEIATKAASLVSGDRERMHGDKRANFDNIARLWNAWFDLHFQISAPGRQYVGITGADVAKLMTLLKIARMESGEYNADDFVDCAGYAAIAGELSAPTEAAPVRIQIVPIPSPDDEPVYERITEEELLRGLEHLTGTGAMGGRG